jgi:uncharacterized repeat protein (TIGR01451 family)
MYRRTVFFAFALGSGLGAVLGLLLGLARPIVPVWAGPGELYVAPDSSCGGASPCYDSVQAAVDAATEGDVIKMATGVYTEVQARPAPPGYSGSAVVTQVAYISKSVTVQGGYTTANWTMPYPLTQPTTLDAQGQGRVMFVTGTVTVTMEGLRITGGNATGLGGISGDDGGGVYIERAAVAISNSQIYSNTTGSVRGYGGGVVATSCGNFSLLRNSVYSNTATGDYGFAGGVYADCEQEVVIVGNTITANRGEPGPWGAGAGGGGLLAGSRTRTVIRDNVIINNQTAGPCGGLTVGGYSASNTVVISNVISGNSAGYYAGGLCLWYESHDVSISGNVICGNQLNMGDRREGGGVYVGGNSTGVTLTNNVIADNRLVSGGQGAGVFVGLGSTCHLVHTTLARNTGGDGSGLFVEADSYLSSAVALTNTIVVSQAVGISVSEYSAVTLEGTLWGDGAWANGIDWAGGGTIVTGTVNVWGDPAFVDPDNGDYHIGVGSAAIDQGVDAGVEEDIDGDWRPMGNGYDIGADELGGPALIVAKRVALDVVQPGLPLTYTISVTNTGNVTLTATITDVLPEHVAPSGTLTWTAEIPAPGVWQETVVVTVDVGYVGPLTNVAQVTTEEGAAGTYTHTLAPGLKVTKRADRDVVQAGEQLTYSLVVTNTGDYVLHATVTDTLPSHMFPGGSITWVPGAIFPGDVWTGMVVVTVEVSYAGPLTNAVQVTTEEGVMSVYNEVVQAEVTPALAITQEVWPDPVRTGGQLTYTIRVTNTGNVTLTAAVTDVLPSYVSPTGVLTWMAVSIAPGDAWQQVVPATVTFGYKGELTNTVQVATAEGATGYSEISCDVIKYSVYLPLVGRE